MLVGVVAVERHPIVRFSLTTGIAIATGDNVHIADQRIGFSHAALLGVRLTRGEQTVFAAPRLDVWYSLRDLAPGSTRRYGLVGIAIERPSIALVKYADGSYDVPMPRPAEAVPSLPVPPNTIPIRCFVRIVGASASARVGSNAALVVHDVDVHGRFDSAGRSRYAVTGAFVERTREPFSASGIVDEQFGYAMHRFRAPVFPLRTAANTLIDSSDVRVLGGTARDFEAQIFAAGRAPDGALDYHASLGFDVSNGRLALIGLAQPVEAIRGHLELFDDTFLIERLRATVAGIPLAAQGSIFHFADPQIRIAVTGEGPLERLRNAFNFSLRQPLAGPLQLAVLVEGALDDPSVVAEARSTRMWYRGFPFAALDAHVVYHHDIVAFLPLSLRYGGIRATGRGSLELGDHIRERMLLHFVTRADAVPYAGALLGAEPLSGDAALDGSDLSVHVGGSMTADRIADAAAVFDFAPNGVANVAPFWMRAGRGEVDAGLRIDRPNGTSALWASGTRVDLHPVRPAWLPGVAIPQLPAIAGSIREAGIVAGGPEDAMALAGSATLARSTFDGIQFAHIGASVDGTLSGAALENVVADGPWGRFTGFGTLSRAAVLARGRFDGSLDALRSAFPQMNAHGVADGEIAFGIARHTIYLQARGLNLHGATIASVPVTGVDGTLSYGDGQVRVYAAHVGLAGGDVVAAGTYRVAPARGAPDALAFVADGIDAGALRGIGVPLERGQVAANGALSAGGSSFSVSSGVSVADGALGEYPFMGSGSIALSGNRLSFDHVIAALAGVYGYANGSVSMARAPSYELHAVVPAADLASALRTMSVPSYDAQGVFNADLTIGGTGVAPRVSGDVGLPAGSVNGLPFLDARGRIDAGAGGIGVQNGSVLVGTTHASFDASTRIGRLALRLQAPSATLSDFNNFFDTGDTLGGAGSLDVGVVDAGRRVQTNGDIDVQRLRIRSLPIGNTVAEWSSRRNLIRGRLVVGGDEGLLRAQGSVALSPQSTWFTTLKRSRYDLSGTMEDLDLGLWVSAFGFPQIPITGRAYGNADVVGTYPSLRLDGEASIRGGTLGRFPIDVFNMRFASHGRRIAIEQAELQGPGITASASGSIGVHPDDPIHMRVRAATEDLPSFLAEVTTAHVPVSGAFQGTLDVGGSLVTPVFSASFNAQNVHFVGMPISTLHGSLRLERDRLELYDAGATFARGSATISGDIPLHLRPFSLPPNTPLRFVLNANNVDPSIFDTLFGNDTELGGTIDARVSIAGTIENPYMAGDVDVANGSYSSSFDEAPITAAQGSMMFSGSQIEVRRFIASAGGGGMQLQGQANLASPAGPTFDGTLTLHGARFDSPAYGIATIDGSLRLSRTAGDALLSGNATMTNTTIPFAAFIGGGGAGTGPSAPPWPLAFDLKLTAGENVHVRGSGYGAGLDIGGSGEATLGGTLASPVLNGSFTSTGGSLTYFDHSFKVLQGAVEFSPSDGLVPTLHALATTTVVNPDPDVARNPYGSATITIDVAGPVNNLKIDFTSDPSGYSNEQILAMLAPFGGLIGGVQYNPFAVQMPGGAAAAVNNAPVPGGVFVEHNGVVTVSQEAFSILNAQFASGLLAPVENVIGQTLGVSDVNLTLGYFGNVGVSVRRVLAKTVTAVYSEMFGLPNRQTFGIRFAPDRSNNAEISFFTQTGPIRLFESPGDEFGPVLLGQPLEGQSGFAVNFQHLF